MVNPSHDSAEDYIALGHALRDLRDQAGLLQDQVAAKVGVKATYISQIENGHRGVRWHTLLRVLSALNADLHQLADALKKQDRAPTP